MGVSAGGVAKNLDQLFITAAAYPPEILLTGLIVNKEGQAVRGRGLLSARPHLAFVLKQKRSLQSAYLDRGRGPHGVALADAVVPVRRRL